MEEKKLQFIQENERKLDPDELKKALANFLHDDMNYIRQLEESMGSFDISDPFGGDLALYRETCKELDKNIKLLKRKVSKDGGMNT